MAWETLLLRAPVLAYNNRHLIQKLWTKFLTFVNAGSADVLIVGRQSVGKSVLCSALYGEASEATYKLPRTSTDIETKPIQLGEWAQIVKVLPGQGTGERVSEMNKIFESDSQVEGIIYVVDWGFTDVRDSVSKEKLIRIDGIDTIEKLRQYNLRLELLDLRSVLTKIHEASLLGRGPKWLVIAVNKVDLYLDKLVDAELYYSSEGNSGFSELLNEYLHLIGQNNIKYKILPISSWQASLDWNKETVMSQLNDKQQEHNLNLNFIEEIAVLNQ